jgi:hypothetical protein
MSYREKIDKIIDESRKMAIKGSKGHEIIKMIMSHFSSEFVDPEDFNISHTYRIMIHGFEIGLYTCRKFEMFLWGKLDSEWEKDINKLIDDPIKAWVSKHLALQNGI